MSSRDRPNRVSQPTRDGADPRGDRGGYPGERTSVRRADDPAWPGTSAPGREGRSAYDVDRDHDAADRYPMDRAGQGTARASRRPDRAPADPRESRRPDARSRPDQASRLDTPNQFTGSPEWDDELGWIERDPEPEPRTPHAGVRRQRSGGATRARSRTRSSRPVTRPQITLPQVAVPRFVAEADLMRDRPAMVMLGGAAFSVAVMAAIMSNRLDTLDAGLPIHIDAAGFPDRWAAPAVLWRIPLLAAMITLMNVAAAWFLAPVDRFASRFLIAAALVVHLLAWIALGDFIF